MSDIPSQNLNQGLAKLRRGTEFALAYPGAKISTSECHAILDHIDEVVDERREAIDLLKELFEYTDALEQSYGAQVAVRGYLSFPEGGPDLGARVKDALGIEDS